MKYRYKIFGYYVESEIELDAYEVYFDKPEVTIRIGKVNKEPLKSGNVWIYFSKENQFVVFHVPEIGAYEISGGKDILIEPDEGAIGSEIQLYLLGSAFGLLMHQKGVFPLHGSTVDMGAFCITFVGHSGAGKTSLASGFIERGFRILSDDVSRIDIIGGVRFVYPSYPSQKIWKDALTQLEIDHDPQKRILKRMEKLYVNDRERFSLTEKPIRAVVEIQPVEVSEPVLMQLKNPDALNVLITHSYRQEIMGQYTDLGAHLRFCSELVMAVPVYRLLRSNKGFTVVEQVDILVDYFGT